MAAQYEVIYSSEVAGVGIVAGGAYYLRTITLKQQQDTGGKILALQKQISALSDKLSGHAP